jgi:lipoprotein-releasing system permease protein
MLGAKKRQISYIFIKLAALLAGASSIIGTIFGILLAYNIDHIRKFIEWNANAQLFDPEIYLLPAIPVSIRISDIAIILAINFSIAVLASIWPAYKSASINVLENIN